jgi:hypothetical protein
MSAEKFPMLRNQLLVLFDFENFGSRALAIYQITCHRFWEKSSRATYAFGTKAACFTL